MYYCGLVWSWWDGFGWVLGELAGGELIGFSKLGFLSIYLLARLPLDIR